jgi:hypothetical protein
MGGMDCEDRKEEGTDRQTGGDKQTPGLYPLPLPPPPSSPPS